MAKQNSKDNKDLTPEELAAKAKAEAAEKEAADKAAAEVESNAKFKGELFFYKGRKYAVNKSVPTFSIGGKVYTTEELPGKLKLVAQLIDLGFAGLVEVK